MAPKFHPKRKIATLPFSALIEIGKPDIYYSIQQALQNEGVLLVDLDTGDVINGQVNVSNIGLIESGKPQQSVHQMGFVQPISGEDFRYHKRDLDAVLVFDTSVQTPDTGMYLLIQVVDADHLEHWLEIALYIARQFVVKTAHGFQPEVTFGVTSLSRSDGTDNSARNTALRKIRNYALDDVDCISDSALRPEQDFDDGDEFDDDDPEC